MSEHGLATVVRDIIRTHYKIGYNGVTYIVPKLHLCMEVESAEQELPTEGINVNLLGSPISITEFVDGKVIGINHIHERDMAIIRHLLEKGKLIDYAEKPLPQTGETRLEVA